MENVEYVICQICGVKKRELNGHLKAHKLSSAQYKEMFPGKLIQCDSIKTEKSLKIKASIPRRPPVTAETRKKMSESQKAHYPILKERMGDEAYKTMKSSAAQKMRESKGGNYRHSEETKNKMRGPRPLAKKPKSEETKQKLRIAAQRRTKRGPHSEATKQKMRQSAVARLEQQIVTETKVKKWFNTKPELYFAQYLISQNILYIQQFFVSTDQGKFNYDFFIPSHNLLVEIDGQYWHTRTEDIIKRDILKTNVARENGYNFLRLSDNEMLCDLINSSQEEKDTHNNKIIESRLKLFN